MIEESTERNQDVSKISDHSKRMKIIILLLTRIINIYQSIIRNAYIFTTTQCMTANYISN